MKCCINCRLVVLLAALLVTFINSEVLSHDDRSCVCLEERCTCSHAWSLTGIPKIPQNPPRSGYSGHALCLTECQQPSPAAAPSSSKRLHLFQELSGLSTHVQPPHHHHYHHHHHPSTRPQSPLSGPVPSFPPPTSAPAIFPHAPSPIYLIPLLSPAEVPNLSPSITINSPYDSPGSAPVIAFPPSPPNTGCQEVCSDPYTSSPPGSPCGCVIPIRVVLELDIGLYALFRLVSELSDELAAGTYLSQSQVRIVGANAVSENLDRTQVTAGLVPLDEAFDSTTVALTDAVSESVDRTQVTADLVPLNEAFDPTTVALTTQRFWSHQVFINETLFGNYSVLSIHYPGLPPSPPQGDNSRPKSSMGPNNQPLGVNVRNKSSIGRGVIAAISLSSAIAVILFLALAWFVLIKLRYPQKPGVPADVARVSSRNKKSGGGSVLSSSLSGSPSTSLASSFGIDTSSAKTYSLVDLENATNRFSSQNIIGEGGFGRVYRGVFCDGTPVAVKVLTRDDRQGGRQFTAEVEMLSRLHHRNLVKLMGICTEEHTRCLVYELIPNGSVESHLHGVDKVSAPLDWEARLRIALGAARGLAYLHEDSNPRVIHRDFKASNILLEDDFTPKVSDFGLAKAASEQFSGHISTRVMGTFGYVAPEYAMTGHLLVKSDVYSYGVVLLELLSGRKPVDMTQPPGQENLVTWARTLLNNMEGLDILVDPSLKGSIPPDSLAKVAAIASMCVQPEVSHRPFMGEVVQALKLVYNDSDASDGLVSVNASLEAVSSFRNKDLTGLQENPDTNFQYDSAGTSYVSLDYDSGPFNALESDKRLSASAVVSTSSRLIGQFSGSFRRENASGPLRPIRSKPAWHRSKPPARGAVSEQNTPLHHEPGVSKISSDRWQ